MSDTIKDEFSWISNGRIYQIFIDRFAGTKKSYTENELRKGFLNGNLKSAIEKLDYIKSLNFNIIWITPFFVNHKEGYHGYHTENFNHVDPRFAYGENIEDFNTGNPLNDNDLDLITKSDEVLINFIQECHKRDIKVMMDIVINHVYETHPFFIDAYKNKNSKYRKWFYFVEDMSEEEYQQLFPMDEFLDEKIIEDNKKEENKKEEIKNEEINEEEIKKKDNKKEEIKKEENKKEENKKEENKKEENKKEEINKEENKKEEINNKNKEQNPQNPKPKKEYCLKYLSFMHLGFLPKLNLDNNECGTYMIKVIKKYLKLGIDSVRVDHAIGASLQFLKRMTSEIHKDFPSVPFIGEVPPCTLIKYAETIKSIPKEKLKLVIKENLNSIPYVSEIFLDFENYLDGLLDFNFKNIVKAFTLNEISFDICIKMIEKHYSIFKGRKLILVKFLDSHDEDRLLFNCHNDRNLMKIALDILFRKFEGRNDPLIFYYGTEDFMSQSKTTMHEDYGDFRTRQPMNFSFEYMKNLLK